MAIIGQIHVSSSRQQRGVLWHGCQQISLDVAGVAKPIELVRNPFNQRFWVPTADKLKLPEATATEIADQIRRGLVGTLAEQGPPGFASLPDLPTQASEEGWADTLR